MTMPDYEAYYRENLMQTMGSLFETVLRGCKMEPDMFYARFVSSGVAEYIEIGSPKYLLGMSGKEMAREILYKTSDTVTDLSEISLHGEGREYWAGWVLAYYQRERRYRFEYMHRNGLSFERVLSMYILHEANIRKFVDEADKIIEKGRLSGETRLAEIRKAHGLSQSRLAKLSGVSLRMIQLYEQRQSDINHAKFDNIIKLSKALACRADDLMQ